MYFISPVAINAVDQMDINKIRKSAAAVVVVWPEPDPSAPVPELPPEVDPLLRGGKRRLERLLLLRLPVQIAVLSALVDGAPGFGVGPPLQRRRQRRGSRQVGATRPI